MSDRSTKPSPRSRNAKASTRGAKTEAADVRRGIDSSAQLGELEFSDWYETPVFELSAEERMETRATVGRTPTRLMARAVIAVGARRDRRRTARRESRDEALAQEAEREAALEGPTEFPSEPKPKIEKVEQPAPVTPAPVRPAPVRPAPVKPAPQPNLTKPSAARPEEARPAAGKSVEAKAAAASSTAVKPAAGKPVEAKPAAAGSAPDPIPPEPDPIPPEPLLIPELADRVGWRKRAGALLDRWADKEVAFATRLDEALAPAIPWASHDRKPAGSRDDATA